MIEKIDIETFLELSKAYVILDARSPGEYAHAHIPGAISFPLFSDEERKLVGTSYKQQSRESAIKIGLDLFGVKMRRMIEEAERISKEHGGSKNFLIHCWRGGMRSAAVAWLLDLYGFKVFTLAGGYKKYRNWALEQFSKPYNFSVLGGYTGSGKTLVLQALEDAGKAVIDLEKIANHKGSAFGALGEEAQPSQEMFENLLAINLRNASKMEGPIWLEDESQRVGRMLIPKEMWETMRKSKVIFLNISFEERLKYLVSTYGQFSKPELISAIVRIQKRLGGLETKHAINFLLENQIDKSFEILLKYYDKLYARGLGNRENATDLITEINCETVTRENYKILK